jgi:hypothetical protein
MSTLREKIIAKLNERGASLPCSRCGRQKFALLDDLARIDQQKDMSVVRFGGPSVPCAIVVCENCGNVSFHAMGALGLMAEISPPEENKNGGNNE